jgi:hypothetical protein
MATHDERTLEVPKNGENKEKSDCHKRLLKGDKCWKKAIKHGKTNMA